MWNDSVLFLLGYLDKTKVRATLYDPVKDEKIFHELKLTFNAGELYLPETGLIIHDPKQLSGLNYISNAFRLCTTEKNSILFLLSSLKSLKEKSKSIYFDPMFNLFSLDFTWHLPSENISLGLVHPKSYQDPNLCLLVAFDKPNCLYIQHMKQYFSLKRDEVTHRDLIIIQPKISSSPKVMTLPFMPESVIKHPTEPLCIANNGDQYAIIDLDI